MNVFIGYDPRQPIAFQVCAHSVWLHASVPVAIHRLDLRNLPLRKRGLTEFTYSRFLVPHLSQYQGWALFLDSDILVRADIKELPKGDAALYYVADPERRFEWPSVMWMNCAKLDCLTPALIERDNMFNMAWAAERNIPMQEMGKEWNHLVDYDPPNPNAKIVHFTKGIPIWPETENCEFADEWRTCLKHMNGSVSFNDLMGRSVHVARKTPCR